MSLGVYVDATKQQILKSAGLSSATAPQATNYHKDYFILQLMEQIQEVYRFKLTECVCLLNSVW